MVSVWSAGKQKTVLACSEKGLIANGSLTESWTQLPWYLGSLGVLGLGVVPAAPHGSDVASSSRQPAPNVGYYPFPTCAFQCDQHHACQTWCREPSRIMYLLSGYLKIT